jgi:antitoxin PrlF
MPTVANTIAAKTSGFETRITSQGQVSVPAPIRKVLGVEPGSTLVWVERGDEVVVRKRGSSTTEDIHKALFPDGRPKKVVSVKKMDEAIGDYMRKKHARG